MSVDYDYINYDSLNHQSDNKKIRFIYGLENLSQENAVQSSNLKGKHLRSNSSTTNRVKFNDIIEFYDPSLHNRANYTLEEFAKIKANPNLIIKHSTNQHRNTDSPPEIMNRNNDSLIGWNNFSTESSKDDSFIPIEFEKIEASLTKSGPVIEFLDENSLPSKSVKTTQPEYNTKTLQDLTLNNANSKNTEFSNAYTGLKSQRAMSKVNKIDLNNFYDEINELNNSKYNEKYPQHYSTPVKITRIQNNHLSQDKPEFKYSTVSQHFPDKTIASNQLNEKIYGYASSSEVNNGLNSLNKFQTYLNPKIAHKPGPTEPVPSRTAIDKNSSIIYTISNQPQTSTTFQPRGVVKIKTNNNLKSSFQSQNFKLQPTIFSIPSYSTKTPIQSQPIDTVSYRQPHKEKTEIFLNNKNLIINAGLPNKVKTAEIKTQYEDDNFNKSETVSEFLTKSKIFTATNNNSIFYDTTLVKNNNSNEESEQARMQRRSSRVGDDQHEKELNSIFKRIYDRHRYSIGSGEASGLGGQNKPVGIRRFSNTNNLSSF